jgi:ABC-type transporter Mla MlaB component
VWKNTPIGARRAITRNAQRKWIKHLLRIRIDETGNTKWLRLDGRVTGPWTEIFERAWREIASALGAKKFGIDLRGVTQIDPRGRQLLAEIHRATSAEFLADSPIIKFYAEEARRGTGSATQEE